MNVARFRDREKERLVLEPIEVESFVESKEAGAMTVAIASFGTGLAVGLVFTALKLPLPAPPVLAGVLGILGIWAGGQLWPILAETFHR